MYDTFKLNNYLKFDIDIVFNSLCLIQLFDIVDKILLTLYKYNLQVQQLQINKYVSGFSSVHN